MMMDDEMQNFAISEASAALEQTSEKMIAKYMKNTFEMKYKTVWHCIVGRNFGAYVTHEQGRYIYFYIGQKGFLLWSTPS
jgi:dynein light chain LC8-type